MAGFKFPYKPSDYGTNYQDIYTTDGVGGGGGNGGGGGGGGRGGGGGQNGGNYNNGGGGGGGRNNNNQDGRNGGGNMNYQNGGRGGKNLGFQGGGNGNGGGVRQGQQMRGGVQLANMVGGGNRDMFGMSKMGPPPPDGQQRDMMRAQVEGVPDFQRARGDGMRLNQLPEAQQQAYQQNKVGQGNVGAANYLNQNGQLDMGAIQKLLAGKVSQENRMDADGTTVITPEIQAANMLSAGGSDGGTLTPEQVRMKAMMYGMNYDPNAFRQMAMAGKGVPGGKEYGAMGKVDDKYTLSVDDYGGMAKGDGKNDLNAQRIINMIERGKLQYPPR